MTSTTSNWNALRQRLDKVQKPVQEFRLCEDSDLRQRYLTAKREAEQAATDLQDLPKDVHPDARAMAAQRVKDADARLGPVKEEYEANTIVLRFTALERTKLEELARQHPATEDDEERGEDFHRDTFAPALISAASLDGMPLEDAQRYLDTWSLGDAEGLWNAAYSIQHHRRTDLGKG